MRSKAIVPFGAFYACSIVLVSVASAAQETGHLFDYETVAEGLEVPWALAFAPDGRMFVSERPGRIRVVEDGVLREEPWAEVAVANVGEAGLMGLALDPDFAHNGYL